MVPWVPLLVSRPAPSQHGVSGIGASSRRGPIRSCTTHSPKKTWLPRTRFGLTWQAQPDQGIKLSRNRAPRSSYFPFAPRTPPLRGASAGGLSAAPPGPPAQILTFGSSVPRIKFFAEQPEISTPHDPPVYRCGICGQFASFGYDVSLRSGVTGRWFCHVHKLEEANACSGTPITSPKPMKK